MDTTVIVVIGVLALIVVGFLIRFRQSLTIFFQGFNLKFGASGKNPKKEQYAISSKEISSKSGGVLLDDSTGKGIDVDRIQANDDVLISTRKANSIDPKV